MRAEKPRPFAHRHAQARPAHTDAHRCRGERYRCLLAESDLWKANSGARQRLWRSARARREATEMICAPPTKTQTEKAEEFAIVMDQGSRFGRILTLQTLACWCSHCGLPRAYNKCHNLASLRWSARIAPDNLSNVNSKSKSSTWAVHAPYRRTRASLAPPFKLTPTVPTAFRLGPPAALALARAATPSPRAACVSAPRNVLSSTCDGRVGSENATSAES
eukprot:1158148-Pleurochrysis_carterae.AAC.2